MEVDESDDQPKRFDHDQDMPASGDSTPQMPAKMGDTKMESPCTSGTKQTEDLKTKLKHTVQSLYKMVTLGCK